eukprot:1159198-Pelagomonas_calceolata.AAC.5
MHLYTEFKVWGSGLRFWGFGLRGPGVPPSLLTGTCIHAHAQEHADAQNWGSSMPMQGPGT